MANQCYTTVKTELIGDGVSLTETIILDATSLYVDRNVKNFKATPDSVTLISIRNELGDAVPATAILSNSGKQVLITFSDVFTGRVTVMFDLGYNI